MVLFGYTDLPGLKCPWCQQSLGHAAPPLAMNVSLRGTAMRLCKYALI